MSKVKYFGPGGQSVTLGSTTDKWAGLNTESATIDTFKSKGNASTPVYFDENGVPQVVTSSTSDGATKLATARTIKLSGYVKGSAKFDGSSDIEIVTKFDAKHIYAFKIDGTISDPSKMITYLEDCADYTPAKMNYDTGEFDWGSWEQDEFFMPRPCMLKYDGTVDYYLNPDDYTLKEDGTASDVANTAYEGNAMMEWGRDGKKIWHKIVPFGDNNTSATIYIANYQVDEDYHAWSFINANGVMMDHFYTPIYNGSLANNKLRSISGQTPATSMTAEEEIAYAEANNPDDRKMWYTEVYADVTLINLLLMLIGRSTDTQTTFGYGNCNSSAASATGLMDTKGLFWGTKAASTDGVKVFGMEHWWGNLFRRYAGHVTNSSYEQLVKLTYGTQDGRTTTGYNTTGSGYITSNANPSSDLFGYASQYMYNNVHGMLPYATSGSSSTYYSDYTWLYSGRYYAYRGGGWGVGAYCGAFYVGLCFLASGAYSALSAAISCKPI